jgi:branched-chain amino acid transport system substrate-binding protein
MKRKRVVFFTLIFCILMTSSSKATDPRKTLKMGLITPLTGAGSSWGIPWEKTCRLYWEEVNARGGLEIGGEKYKIEIIVYDEKYVAAEARGVAEKLIFQDKVKYIQGPISSAGALAVCPYTNEHKVITVTGGMMTPLDKYTFHGIRHSASTSFGLVSWIAKNRPHWKRFALLGPDDSTGWGQTRDEIQFINEVAKGQVVALEFWARGTKDFYPILTKLRTSNPDVVMTDGTPTAEQGIIMKQAAELGWKTNWANHGSTDLNILLKVASKADIEGAIVSTYIHEPPIAPKAVLEWKEKYIARYKTFDETSILWYTPQAFMEAVWRKAGSIDVDKFVIAAENLGKFNVLYGEAFLGGKTRRGWNHGVCEPTMYCQIKDGKLEKLALMPPMDVPALKVYPPARP